MFYVYILANKRNGTLYIGTTNNLIRRVSEHQSGEASELTAKYGVNKLVYYEATPLHIAAIEREKRMKAWNRKWKLELIEKMTPEWNDENNENDEE